MYQIMKYMGGVFVSPPSNISKEAPNFLCGRKEESHSP